MMLRAVVCAACLLISAPAALAQGLLEDVIVHGNHTTPTADVLTLAGVTTGQAITPTLLTDVERRLRDSGRFADVSVQIRQRSLDASGPVMLVIVVTERPGISDRVLSPGLFRRLGSALQVGPVLQYDDGYGATYGLRPALSDRPWRNMNIVMPLTWGGDRKAALEVLQSFQGRLRGQVRAGAGIDRRVNPHFEVADTRRSGWLRADLSPRPWWRVSGQARRSQVRFAGVEANQWVTGVSSFIDSRPDEWAAALGGRVGAGVDWLRLDGQSGGAIRRTSADAAVTVPAFGGRGAAGGWSAPVLSVRARTQRASAPLPLWEQALLGGALSLRGLRPGVSVGDNLTTVSAELRTSRGLTPLARAGVRAFLDGGAVSAAGQALRDEQLTWGAGGGVFLQFGGQTLALDVAWPRTGGRPRLHLQIGAGLGR